MVLNVCTGGLASVHSVQGLGAPGVGCCEMAAACKKVVQQPKTHSSTHSADADTQAQHTAQKCERARRRAAGTGVQLHAAVVRLTGRAAHSMVRLRPSPIPHAIAMKLREGNMGRWP
jgi:hypothetical protein